MSIAARRLQRAHSTSVVVAPPSGTYSQVILTDSPTVYYPMQERNGTTLVDASGHSKHGTYVGSNIDRDYASNPYLYAPVALGYHMTFDSTSVNDSYMQLPANCLDTTNGFTFEAWVLPSSWGYGENLFCIGDDIAFVHNWQTTTFSFWVNGVSFTIPDTTLIGWHHLVATVPAGGGTGAVYYDGALVGSGTVGALTQQARSEIYIGRASGGSNAYYSGFMTQAAIYPTALSAARVQAHYVAGLADADPVVHGTAEWWDASYYNQFTNGSVLANASYVATADWMPAAGDAAAITRGAPYYDVGINAIGNDYGWFRAANMHVLDGGSMPGTRGTETIGLCIDDEPDMRGDLTGFQDKLAAASPGYLHYANFGNFITLGQGSPVLTQGDFTNATGLTLQSADLYWYAFGASSSMVPDQYWKILESQFRRACNYGATVQRARSYFDTPRPQWGFVELAHPGTQLDRGGPNPDQVEGAVWGNIIGGARGIIYFHHSFSDGVPPNWDNAATYVEGACVVYGGEYYYAALTPAVGQVPALSSYTWVRWSPNSGAGIDNITVRHPDLPARLIKIKQDLQVVAQAIHSPTVPHLCHQGIYSTYRPNALDGKKYIIALPGLNAPNGGTFSMHLPKGQTPTSIEVVGESRTITPSGGMFTDTFAAEYSHHIYRWT